MNKAVRVDLFHVPVDIQHLSFSMILMDVTLETISESGEVGEVSGVRYCAVKFSNRKGRLASRKT